MDEIVEDTFSWMETLRHFLMYANVGRVTTEPLLDARGLSQ